MALMGGYNCGMKVIEFPCFLERNLNLNHCVFMSEINIGFVLCFLFVKWIMSGFNLLNRLLWFQVNCLDIAPNNIATVISLSNTASTLTGIISPYLVGLLTPDVSLFIALFTYSVIYIVQSPSESSVRMNVFQISLSLSFT